MTAHMTFDDEFNSLSLWNGSSGTWDTTFWYDDNNKGSTLAGNGEQEMYINANYAPTASVKPWTVSNGVLTLQAAPASPSISKALGGAKYTSGQINTYHSFSQEYGYFEMKAQLPAGQGLWPAFWLMPTDGSWPPELDIMEVLGNDPTHLYTTVHTNETGSHTYSTQNNTVADTSKGYHTYGVDWEADKITWYFDGKAIFQAATPSDMHKPMYIIANLAVGGNWPGNPDATTKFPAKMNIDYIRAWDSNPYADSASTGTGSTGTGSTPSNPPPASSSDPGQTLTATHTASVLSGGAGADTLIASQASDTLTGGAGADHFVLTSEPWSPIHITDFKVGEDTLDLSALFKAAGYTGSDPVKDHYVTFESDGNGGTLVRYEHSGQANINGHWPNTIVDLEHVSPTGLTWASLQGPATSSGGGTTTTPPPATGAGSDTTTGAAGQTLTAAHTGASLTGGAGADTLIASQASDTLTGGAGADVFVFKTEPWSPIHITDFQPGQDKLDLSALFKTAGYAGSDPIADHYMTVESDGAGGSLLRYEHSGQANLNGHWPNTIIDLEHVAPSQVKVSDWIIH
jgi:beta-glucanase (GH16 family)